MKFEEAQKYAKKHDELTDIKRKNQKPDETIKASEKNTTSKDPKSYPDPLIPWDSGIADRGPTGFSSDKNALTGKEKIGKK